MKIFELSLRNVLPNKKFFNGYEVASFLNVQPQDVCGWEADFPQIRSLKTAKGQRIYRREDVILFAAVKHLLKEKKLTVAGAQRVLAESDENFLLDSFKTKIESKTPISHEMLLQEAAHMLESCDEFDHRHRKISEESKKELAANDLNLHKDNIHHNSRVEGVAGEPIINVNNAQFAKARATLMASRESLYEVLELLKKYNGTSHFIS